MIGMTGAIIALVSFFLNGEYRIRIVNIVATALFVVYAILSQSWTILLLNSILIIVHIYKLRRRIKRRNKILNKLNSIYTYDNKQVRKL